ncbi:hypothetical protein [Amycolatopsis sp. CA-126428]|uniref:hypothetical protein n=1 Tax=Amycolatopsis sp. CA-126428 TaxID=2073158 RepID=UPI0011B0D888|nr:hypothetical protein [Amycolatopsis sp. CA-126428]
MASRKRDIDAGNGGEHQNGGYAARPRTAAVDHRRAGGRPAACVAAPPHPIPPWPLLLALVAVLGTVTIIVLAIVHSIAPSLATAGAVSSVIGAGIHWSKRHTRGRTNTRP